MTARSDIQIDGRVSPRIITVDSPSKILSVQDLHDTLREWEDDIVNMEQSKICNASGKDDLRSGDLAVVITLTLLDATVGFEARSGPTYIQCDITGGNLVALDAGGSPIDPIDTTDFTQVVRTVASSSVVV